MGHDKDWAMQEFAGAKVADARLAKHLIKLADRLGNAPSASIPGVCNGKAETVGAGLVFCTSYWQDRIKGARTTWPCCRAAMFSSACKVVWVMT